MSDYQIVWRDANGVQQTILNAFQSLEFAYSERVVGSLSLVLPSQLYNHRDFGEDHILEIRRKVTGGDFYTERVFFVRSWKQDSLILTLTAYDPIYLLTGRIVAYAANSAYTVKSGPADDVIKEIVYENIVTGATEIERRLAGLTVTGDLSLGATVSSAFSRNKMLDTLQKIADASIQKGTYITFDLVPTGPAAFEFTTYDQQRGENHGLTSADQLIMSEKFGNLINVEIEENRTDEVNTVYAGGTGTDADRVVVEVSSSDSTNTPWSRREKFHDASNIADTTALTDAAYAELRAGRPRKILTGQVQQVEGSQYGVHYGFGDLVVIEGFGYSADARLSTVHISVNKDKGETIDLKLRGEW